MSKNLYFELNQYNSLLSFQHSGDYSIYITFNNVDIGLIDKRSSDITTYCSSARKKSILKLLKSFFNMSNEDANYTLDNRYSSFFIDKAMISFNQFSRNTQNKKDFICRLDIMINKKYIPILSISLNDDKFRTYYITRDISNDHFNSLDDLYNNIHKHLKLKFTDYQKDMINAVILNKQFLK